MKRHWHWARWLEPWFGAYALVGLLVNGIVPLLIPLTTQHKGPLVVGVVVASFFAGQLSAPVVGGLADRTGRQRLVFLGSFPIMGAAAIAFGLAEQTWVWIVAAIVAGAAAGAAQTLGSVFIVEGHPRAEWDLRIGWFRLVFGFGQVAGLLIGAVFADGRLELGWIVTGIVISFGALIGRIHLPRLKAVHERNPPAGAPTSRVDELKQVLRSHFGVFLLTWLLAMIGVQTFLNVMPLVMRDTFATDPSRTALLYLVGSAAGALLYPVCGEIASKRSAAFVLSIGLIMTIVAFVVMTAVSIVDPTWKAEAGAVALITVAVAYPFDYIGATMLAAELAPNSEGSAMGLFNSAVAAGAIIGAIVPSFLAKEFGYKALPPLSAGLVVLAVVVGHRILFSRQRPGPVASATATTARP